jgi:cobalt/nickel transport system permease protein
MLFAVHISDGVLATPWWLGGYAVAGVLVLASAWRVRDDEVPRIALLTAAFFVISLIHVPVGFTSVHLLMNGLVGIVLGPRAALAIFCGLFLQYWLVGHGGQQTIGVNTCIISFPALLAWLLLRACQRLPWLRHPGFRALLVMTAAAIWLLSLVFSVALVRHQGLHLDAGLNSEALAAAWTTTVHPGTLGIVMALAAAAAWGERRLENAPEFPLGLLVGELAVLATVALNCAVLLTGMEDQYWAVPPLVLLVAHLPIAVVEGIILGFTLGFLAKVKPELLGELPPPRPAEDSIVSCQAIPAHHS